MGALTLGVADVPAWFKSDDREIYLGDMVEPEQTGALSLSYARYGKGATVDWTVAYDEAIIVVRGAFTVEVENGETVTARAGEVLFVPRGTTLNYSAAEETDMIVVTNPHWKTATEEANLVHLLEGFHEVDGLGGSRVTEA